jgi:hypothetical protein
VTIPINQLSAAILDNGELLGSRPFDFEEEVTVIEGQTPLQERHWLVLQGHQWAPE